MADEQGAAATDAPAGTAPATGTAAPTAPATGASEGDGVDWKAQARRNENDLKRVTRELEAARQAAMTDTEKAVAAAKLEGATEARRSAGTRLAAAEAKAALTGVVTDPAAVVEDLDLSRFVTPDGDVDDNAIKALRDKWAKLGGGARQQTTALRQGDQSMQAPASGEDWIRQQFAARK